MLFSQSVRPDPAGPNLSQAESGKMEALPYDMIRYQITPPDTAGRLVIEFVAGIWRMRIARQRLRVGQGERSIDRRHEGKRGRERERGREGDKKR